MQLFGEKFAEIGIGFGQMNYKSGAINIREEEKDVN